MVFGQGLVFLERARRAGDVRQRSLDWKEMKEKEWAEEDAEGKVLSKEEARGRKIASWWF